MGRVGFTLSKERWQFYGSEELLPCADLLYDTPSLTRDCCRAVLIAAHTQHTKQTHSCSWLICVFARVCVCLFFFLFQLPSIFRVFFLFFRL